VLQPAVNLVNGSPFGKKGDAPAPGFLPAQGVGWGGLDPDPLAMWFSESTSLQKDVITDL
jgi:hypothetical protein